MSLQSFFNSLSTPKKVGFGVALGAATLYTIDNLFFSKIRTPGFPDASNLYGFAPTMTREEALQILNFTKKSVLTKQEVQKHHRVLMALHHPDKGGSSYIATKVNEARDFLTLGARD